MAEPLHVALEDLRIDPANEGDAGSEELIFDLGNLCAYDPTTPATEAFFDGSETTVKRMATKATRALLSRLSQLPRPRGPAVVALPTPMTPFPRSKPIPSPKSMTRWEAFAKSKGIRKKKKEKKVWDEGTGQWRRRFGYKRANDSKDVIVLDAKAADKPGESPFEKMDAAKRDRVNRQSKREIRNVQRATKRGEWTPPTVQLSAELPKHGKGHPTRRKDLKDEIGKASKLAGISTASMGKFDERRSGEDADERVSTKKRRMLVSAHELGEKQFLSKMSRQLVHQHSEKLLDVEKAMGRLEADKRRHRHQEKIDETLQQKHGFTPRSQKKTRKGERALPKIKVTSRGKRMKRRHKKSG